MLKLKEVDEAKTLMLEAYHWSVVRWLAEKKRVRRAADRANALLDALYHDATAAWPPELRAAYDALAADSSARSNGSGAAVHHQAAQLRHAYETAYRARMDAEDTFDVAERRLSTAMAREGTRKAILSWELFEAAIAKSREASAQPTA
jgi:hypothetical protein